MLSFTLWGSPGEFDINRINGDLNVRLINNQHEKLVFVGMDVVEPFVAWDVYSDTYNKHLNNLKNRLINLDNLPVIPFHKLEECDETGALKRVVHKRSIICFSKRMALVISPKNRYVHMEP